MILDHRGTHLKIISYLVVYAFMKIVSIGYLRNWTYWLRQLNQIIHKAPSFTLQNAKGVYRNPGNRWLKKTAKKQ